MKTINFNDYEIKLSRGSHISPAQGMCIMECVAYIAGEQHTDRPECASDVVTELAIRINDICHPDHRNDLIKHVLRLAGSKAPHPIELERLNMMRMFVFNHVLADICWHAQQLTLSQLFREASDMIQGMRALDAMRLNVPHFDQQRIRQIIDLLHRIDDHVFASGTIKWELFPSGPREIEYDFKEMHTVQSMIMVDCIDLYLNFWFNQEPPLNQTKKSAMLPVMDLLDRLLKLTDDVGLKEFTKDSEKVVAKLGYLEQITA